MHKRNLTVSIKSLALARGKMAFISGPRQVGKTTLAKILLKPSKGLYGNWDDLDFRRRWAKSPKSIVWPLPENSRLILDEIHKAPRWKQNLKGLYDTLEKKLGIIVTGSARLDLYKKGSDSLMGRYLGFRLHPFSIGEIIGTKPLSPVKVEQLLREGLSLSSSKDYWNDLKAYGGFPEPLWGGSQKILRLWQKGRIDKIVREDIRDLGRIPEMGKMEMLISLLPERVASPLSLKSLGEDLEVSYDTAKRWTDYLKTLYYFFEVRPWSKRIARSLKKEKKIYLWDWSEVTDPGARFENMVASHLLKACHFWTDTGEGKFELFYLKTKDKREVDFLVIKDGNPWLPIECKLKDTSPTSHLQAFTSALKVPVCLQLVEKDKVLKKRRDSEYVTYICSASSFLRHLP